MPSQEKRAGYNWPRCPSGGHEYLAVTQHSGRSPRMHRSCPFCWTHSKVLLSAMLTASPLRFESSNERGGMGQCHSAMRQPVHTGQKFTFLVLWFLSTAAREKKIPLHNRPHAACWSMAGTATGTGWS